MRYIESKTIGNVESFCPDNGDYAYIKGQKGYLYIDGVLLEKEDIPIKPEFIFSNSRGPGYNMVFRSKSDYDLFMENSKKRIEKLIDEIIKTHDVWYYTYKRIRLYYWHLEMKDINLYGLYRED